jgi:predicted enzyme related to lactoylglutathione lyase
MRLDLVTLVVDDYDKAIDFFVNVLGFALVEDSPALSESERPKRWVVVRPAGAHTGIVLAQADGPEQIAVLGKQAGGRVAFFLGVDDFDEAYSQIVAKGVHIVREPLTEPYGRVAVFLDCMGNSWDLLGPA